MKKNENEEDEQKDYDKKVNNYESQSNNDNDNDKEINLDNLEEENEFNVNLTEKNNFEDLKVHLPIALPNGLCLFHSYQLKKYIDYEVTCSYNEEIRNNIIEEFTRGNPTITNYLIYNSYYYDKIENIMNNYYLKKVEIIYYNIPDGDISYKIYHYYEVNNDNFVDLTVDVKFVNDDKDFKLSGNPGYIKGKQIIFGTKDNDNKQVYNNGIVFPIEKADSNTEESTSNLYYDNYMDNKITFEDLIIYGYHDDNYKSIFSGIFKNIKFAQFGNSKSFKDLVNNDNNDNNVHIVLIGEYKDSGVVNNTQFQIYDFDFAQQNQVINTQNSYRYFIVKFIKLQTDTEWYYAPGPVIIKLPRNIMYPFKIGTSKYS